MFGVGLFTNYSVGYAEARYLLDNEYGDQHKIATLMLTKRDHGLSLRLRTINVDTYVCISQNVSVP